MYYAKLLLVIALLSVCSFTLVQKSSRGEQPIIHLLLNGEPVDAADPLSFKTQGHFDVLVLEQGSARLDCSFAITLVRANKPAVAPIRLQNRKELRDFPLEGILKNAQPGDRIIVEITSLEGSLYYNLKLG